MQNPGHLPPALPPTHYLDNRIFTDASIFREEQERLFSKVWQFVCHESELPNSGDFNGALYALSADMRMTGGGNAVVNWCGACVTRSVTMTGHQKFHYDEALRAFGPPAKIVVISWVEL